MLNNFESFDNSETSARKSALIQEREGLVSTHMYKQFLDYQHANINTNEIFARIIDNLQIVVDTLKEAFSSRNVTTQNISKWRPYPGPVWRRPEQRADLWPAVLNRYDKTIREELPWM